MNKLLYRYSQRQLRVAIQLDWIDLLLYILLFISIHKLVICDNHVYNNGVLCFLFFFLLFIFIVLCYIMLSKL